MQFSGAEGWAGNYQNLSHEIKSWLTLKIALTSLSQGEGAGFQLPTDPIEADAVQSGAIIVAGGSAENTK